MRKRSLAPTITRPTGKTCFWVLLLALAANVTQSSGRPYCLQEKPPSSSSPKPSGAEAEGKSLPDKKQTPAPTQEEHPVKLESSLIQLSVFVSDKSGQPITNLGREDFEVLENGQPQKLTGFSLEVFDTTFLSGQAARSETEEKASDFSRQSRTILLLVDDLHLGVENFSRTQKALLEFVNYEVRDNDQVAIVTTSGALGFLQQLTEDRAVMRLAINRLGPRSSLAVTGGDRPIRNTYQAELVLLNDREVIGAGVSELRAENPMLDAEVAERMVVSAARRVIQQSEQWALASVNTIANALKNVQQLEGAKIAILVSDGFLMSASNTDQSRERFKEVINAATRASMVVYTVDSRGLTSDTDDATVPSSAFSVEQQGISHRLLAGDRQSRQDTLVTVAHETGGTAFVNSNDLRLALQSVLQQNNVYYSLAYQAGPSNTKRKDDFRKIEVRVRGATSQQVRFQRGYATPSVATKRVNAKETAANTPQQQFQQALGSIAPVKDVGLSARTNFVSLTNTGPVAITAILVDAATITLQPDASLHRGSVDLLGLFYSSDGKLVHQFSKTIVLNLRPETYRAVMQSGVQFIDQWNPSPGLYQIRTAARDAVTGRIGTATQWLEVPDLTAHKLALSDIFFLGERPTEPAPASSSSEGVLPGRSGDTSQIDPRLLVPALMQFQRGKWLNFGVFVYHRTEQMNNDFVVQIQLVRNSMPVFTSPLRLISKQDRVDSERLFYGSRLSLEGLAPGRYFLQVIVIDRTSRERAFGRIDFSVT